MDMSVFYAVNKNGQGCIFEERPRKDTILEIWTGQYSGSVTIIVARMEALGFVLPKITWNDDPVKLKLSLSYEE